MRLLECSIPRYLLDKNESYLSGLSKTYAFIDYQKQFLTGSVNMSAQSGVNTLHNHYNIHLNFPSVSWCLPSGLVVRSNAHHAISNRPFFFNLVFLFLFDLEKTGGNFWQASSCDFCSNLFRSKVFFPK